MDIAVLRFIISSIALFFIAILSKIRFPDKRDWFSFIQLGLLLFLNMISLNYGMRTITAGETTLILSSSQLFQVLLAWLFLKESISIRFLTGLFFCFTGMTLIAFQNTIVYIGLAALIANLCWSKVLSQIKASRAAIFLYTVPVMTIVFGFLWLNELPPFISFLGGAVILGGVIISNMTRPSTEPSLPPDAHSSHP
jgi:drug/metabolite transporter (DMT)-like permease